MRTRNLSLEVTDPSGVPVPAKPDDPRRWSPWPLILLATLAGGIARAAPVLAAGFPVNDGGLFASFVDAILAGPQLLPDTISYNGLNAPFAYPPLAFLATAGLERVLPIGIVEWLRWIPLTVSIAAIPAFALLALELAPTRVHAVIAVFAFALVPSTFEWLVMGGGLTRAPGFLLAILTVWMGVRFLRTQGRAWLGTGICLGLTVLTHPAAGLFAALSLVLVTLARARGRRAWAGMIAAAAVGVAITSPWLLLVVGRHGIAPLLSAGGTGANLMQSAFYLLSAQLTDEPLWGLTAGLAVLGFIYLIAMRRYFVPVWVLAMVIVDPRSAATHVSIPLAILAAVGLLDVVVARLVRVGGDLASAPGWPDAVLRSRAVSATLGGALVLALLSAFLAPYLLSPMASLSADARAAMAWAESSMPSTSNVVIVTGRTWYEDATSEWFPYLSRRHSVATVQGFEWAGASAWQSQRSLSDALRDQATDTITSLESWARRYRVGYDYVYLPKGPLGGARSREDCCSALRSTLIASPDYEIVYDGPGATIGRRLQT